MNLRTTHALIRTSPKGGPFIGYCVNCGKTTLPYHAVHEPCENLAGRSEDATKIAILEAADS